ncbi:MAG: hypothetical protein GX810_02805 [Clostridiales bacterium]|nr:hypothetical protein [Clostridiales bacterium]
MRIPLDGDWTLYFCSETGGKPDVLSPKLLAKCQQVLAKVPGYVELALMRAGLLDDPLYGENLYNLAPYEYCQWVYAREFAVPEDFPEGEIVLAFDGIDTIADVYLNDLHVGRSENMLVAHEFDVTQHIMRGQTYTLYVHIHSTMNYVRAKQYTVAMRGTGHRNEICHIRKAPHMFGWDIAPRAVSAGLWKGCALVARNRTRLTETYYATPKLEDGGIWLQYAYRFVTDLDTLQGLTVRVRGTCGDHVFEHALPAHFVSANHEVFIRNPLLWWPRGYGDQPLYEVTMTLLKDGEVLDERRESIGLRTLRLERDFTPGQQKFQIYVNELPIFVMGTNWVPLDAFHSRDAERLAPAFDLLVASGVNTVRCWGGNVYESDAFYDRCDRAGILVWQDFSMGNTNYPQTDDFVPVLEDEMGQVMRRLRNHACLMLWASDNEVDLKNMGYMYPTYDSRRNRVAQDTLRSIVQAHDPYRFYLCSSPEIPEGFDTTNVPEQHTWGPRAWYKDDFYRLSSASFIGEAGYHGCPAAASLARFLPEDKLWPYDNDAWAMHSTEDIRIEPNTNGRNVLMANQVKLLCGHIPDDLDTFVRLSQISQGEALKFFIERARALKWRRSGIIWWNLLDGWPQISDAVVDYYFEKKRAFDYVRRAQAPVLVFFDEPSGWHIPLLAANDTRRDVTVTYAVRDADTAETLATGERLLPAGCKVVLDTLFHIVSDQRLYLIEWTANGARHVNHYLTGFPAYDADTLLTWADALDAFAKGDE